MKITFIIILICLNSIFSEIIDGPANIRYSPEGKVKIELNDSIFFYASEPDNGWYKIMVTAFVKKQDLIKECVIKSDAILYFNDYKTSKGITKDTINVCGWYQDDDSNSQFIEVMIFGYTFTSNIRQNSILERETERIVNNSTLDSVKFLINKFGFDEVNIDSFNVYLKTEDNDPWMSPDIRMLLIYDKNDRIIGIANNDKKLRLKHVGKGKIVRNLNIYYLVKLDLPYKKHFETAMTEYLENSD